VGAKVVMASTASRSEGPYWMYRDLQVQNDTAPALRRSRGWSMSPPSDSSAGSQRPRRG